MNDSTSLGSLSRTRTRGRPVEVRDVVAVVDTWVLLLVMWAARLALGYVDPSLALFAVALFGSLVWPSQTSRLTVGVLEDVGPVLRRLVCCFAAAMAASVLLSAGDQQLLLVAAAGSLGGLLVGRAFSYALGRSLNRTVGRPRALILGAGEVARQIIGAASSRPEYGFEIVGAVDDDPRFASSMLGTQVLGGLDDVPRLVAEHGIDNLIVTFSLSNPRRIVSLVRHTQAHGASVWVVPRLFELGLPAGVKDSVWGVPLIRLAGPARTRPQWLLKRVLDVVLAGAGLIVSAPLMGLIALATWLDSGRPILLRQTRISTDGKEFCIYKFRTMTAAPEEVEGTEWGADPDRVTRVGGFLRDSSLDELPQLFNVLRGDMSLVGPRPERPHFVDSFSHEYYSYDQRHRVPAGMTGLAQVNGLRGADTSMEDRVALDNYYIENWSLSEDMKILLKTIKVLKD